MKRNSERNARLTEEETMKFRWKNAIAKSLRHVIH